MPSSKDISKYRAFLNNKNVHLFHQIWWWDTITNGRNNWELLFLEKDNKVIDALPYRLERKWGFQLLRPPLLTPYSGNFFSEHTLTLFEKAAKIGKDECQITLQPDFFIPNAKESPTYILDLTHSEAEIWQQTHKMRRRNITNAKKRYQLLSENIDLESFIAFHRLAFEAKATPYPFTASFLERIITKSKENNAVFSFTAKDGDAVAAQIIIFYDYNTAYYLLGSINPNLKKNTAMSWLMYESILKAKSIGLKTFDFEGSRDLGIASFFQKFGGRKQNYTILEAQPSRLWKLKKKILN